jgi:mono/diheme cytochrome c family protein
VSLRSTPRRTGLVLAALAALALGIAALWLRPQIGRMLGLDEPATLRPADPQALALGEKVYVTHCAACHGARLEGQPNWRERQADGRLPAPPHDASGHTWHHADALLVRLTKLGVARAAGLKDYDSAMPAYEGVLSDEEIVAVLSWIKSQWPVEVQAKHDQINAQARAAQR